MEIQSNFEVLFTRKAIIDLNRIKNYYDGQNPSFFDFFQSKIYHALQMIESQPYLHSVFLKINDMEYRRIIIYGYVIVYDVDEVTQTIFVDRIFHHSENYFKKLYR